MKNLPKWRRNFTRHLLLLSTFSDYGSNEKVLQLRIIFQEIYNMMGWELTSMCEPKLWEPDP